MSSALSMKELLAKARAAKEATAATNPVPASSLPKNIVREPAPTQASPAPAGKLCLDSLKAKLGIAPKIGKPTGTSDSDKVAKLAVKADLAAISQLQLSSLKDKADLLPDKGTNIQALGMHGEAITYNSEQQEFIDLASSGKSCVLIGAAGTGKTTCSKGMIKALLDSGKIPTLKSDGHKHLVENSPGIVIISYTRRAVNNIRKVQSDDMKHNCITVHKLLEYRPEYFEIIDPVTGVAKNTMRFEPSRNINNPLQVGIVA